MTEDFKPVDHPLRSIGCPHAKLDVQQANPGVVEHHPRSQPQGVRLKHLLVGWPEEDYRGEYHEGEATQTNCEFFPNHWQTLPYPLGSGNKLSKSM